MIIEYSIISPIKLETSNGILLKCSKTNYTYSFYFTFNTLFSKAVSVNVAALSTAKELKLYT